MFVQWHPDLKNLWLIPANLSLFVDLIQSFIQIRIHISGKTSSKPYLMGIDQSIFFQIVGFSVGIRRVSHSFCVNQNIKRIQILCSIHTYVRDTSPFLIEFCYSPVLCTFISFWSCVYHSCVAHIYKPHQEKQESKSFSGTGTSAHNKLFAR